ncbi:MAG: acetylglutamate kinase [Ruminococcus sp.]|nr:acetylglutamate kinase [Ruminococcus sp.]
MDNNKRAEILIQAMPYIQKWSGQTIVVKYGGNAMKSEELKEAVMKDIVLMQLVGINVVLVHGGGPEISQMLDKTGKKSEFKNGLRVTDKETIDIVQQVLAGKVNKSLVQHLSTSGGRAIGLCGLDGKMLMAKKLEGKDDLGYVGEIDRVNPMIIRDSLKNGYIPVISTIAGGYDGEVYNINADLAAAKIASKLGAVKLMLMTDIRGLLRDINDEESLISVVNANEVPKLKKEGIISGGMIPKIDCCVDAVKSNVSRAHILDGRLKHSLLLELFSDEGIGTMIY